MGVKISCDLNYRNKLWSKEKAGQVMRTHIINQQEAIERNLAGPEK